jgi:hypothetical protein
MDKDTMKMFDSMQKINLRKKRRNWAILAIVMLLLGIWSGYEFRGCCMLRDKFYEEVKEVEEVEEVKEGELGGGKK